MKQDAPTAGQRSLFAPPESQTTYEQPLNERIRSFLRLEHLFDSIAKSMEGRSLWDSRAAIAGMIEVTDLLSRSDIKAELIKELERQGAVLGALQRNPAVDAHRLEAVMGNITGLLGTLKSHGCQPGQCLRQDELIATIRQRITIPGGTCNFDLPGFHHWLSKPDEERAAHLVRWFDDLRVVRDGASLSLNMIRDSATPSRAIAAGGFYQQSVDSNVPSQLIRIVIPADATHYPEISGGKHRFTVRFLEQPSTSSRPTQVDRSVEFDLQCCVL